MPRPPLVPVTALLLLVIFVPASPAQESGTKLRRSAESIFALLDRNKDGQLDRTETPRRLREKLERIDSDGNGTISARELGAALDFVFPASSQPLNPGGPTDPNAIYGGVHQGLEVARIENITLRDDERRKDLNVRVTFPVTGGPYPVIVFSHGLYGSKDGYLELTEYWAAHGYVVIQANHQDSIAGGAKFNDPGNLRAWPERPADVSLILDSLSQLESGNEALAGKLDSKHIGAGGHSFGAGTSQLIAGARARLRGRQRSFADERVAAALLMSPQGPGGILAENSWEKISMPMMVMSGSADGPTMSGQPAESRRKPYELSPPGNKYLVWIEGLDHGFGNLTGSGRYPDVPAHKAWVQATALAFWDAWLKDSAEARDLLSSEKIPTLTGDRVSLSRK